MIAKNIKGKSFGGCVRYVMNETAELLEAEGLLAGTTAEIIRGFAMQRSSRKEVKQPVGHIPLSFAPEDKERMTNDFMIQLAKEYMEDMGIKNTQYIIVRHHNSDNDHLHIVYNRIDNNLKLISVNHDFKRNIKVCKKLKNKYGLTYVKGKERVKREKLKNPDKAKYYIYDAVKSVVKLCKNPADLLSSLKKFGINLEYRHNRRTSEIEGISFRYGDIAFKGSQVDRKFSFANLKKQFQKNIEEAKKQEREKHLHQQAEQTAKPKPQTPSNFIIGGVMLNDEQQQTLTNGGYIYLENMSKKNEEGKFSSYVFLNEENNKAFFSNKSADKFIKYGQYEMRIRDKILIENGYITKAKVKWWGGGNFAYPYLWKNYKSNTEYKESWGNPRLPKSQEPKKATRRTPIQKKNRGNKM